MFRTGSLLALISLALAPAARGETIGPRVTVSLESLLFWPRSAPLSVPLVSTGPIATTHHGILGSPENGADSTVLYGAPFSPAKGGNAAQPFGNAPGLRATVAAPLTSSGSLMLEAAGFLLFTRQAGYTASGDASGNPILGIPVHNSVLHPIGGSPVFPGEDSIPVSLPDDPARGASNGIITGGVAINNRIDFWGIGLRLTAPVARGADWEFSALAGARHVMLRERFGLKLGLAGLSGPYVGQSGTAEDMFKTKNRFYGADLGVRGLFRRDRWSVEVSGSFAPGINAQAVAIDGHFVTQNFGPEVVGAQGIFAQPSNIGTRHADRFTFLTDTAIKLGYALGSGVAVTLGWEHLYIDRVVRPTDQIDRNINTGQVFAQAGPQVSSAYPSKRFKTTSFHVQGITLGMAVQF